jgi:hypothetical protein
MKVVRRDVDRLVLDSDSRALDRLLLAVAIAMAAVAATRYLQLAHPFGNESFQGAAAAGLLALVGFVGVFERSRFEFNRASGDFHWRQRRAFWERSGKIALSAIRHVVIQNPIGAVTRTPPLGPGVRSRRICVITDGREEIPLGISYVPDPDSRLLELAGEIRTFLGMHAADVIDESVRAAALAGDTIGAVRLLRQERGLSLSDAEERIHELLQEPGGADSSREGVSSQQPFGFR